MIPQFPEFKKLELLDKQVIDSFTKQFPPYSDFNFTSMWSWDTRGETALSLMNNNLIIRFNDYLSREPFYSFLGVNHVEETINRLTDLSVQTGLGSKLKFVPEEIVVLCKNQDYLSIPDQDNFDYIYNMQDFFSCEGKTYETQRNQIHRFEKKYPTARVEIYKSFDSIKQKILLLEQKWKLNKLITEEALEFRNESDALKRILDLKQDNFITTCVFVEHALVAFCVSELLDSNFAISHFAKADTSFSGVYSFLLHKTCGALLNENRKFLNYEQDLGIVYLRNSKTSFRPATFLKKFVVIKQ